MVNGVMFRKKKIGQNLVLIVRIKEENIHIWSIVCLESCLRSAFSELNTEGKHSRAAEEPALSRNTKRKWLLNKVSQLRS